MAVFKFFVKYILPTLCLYVSDGCSRNPFSIVFDLNFSHMDVAETLPLFVLIYLLDGRS